MANDAVGLTRFVILAAPRTGSNWLCSLLDSHPDILCHHEVFNPAGIFFSLGYRDGTLDLGTIEFRDRQPLEFLRRLWQAHMAFPCVGFKMTRGQDERVFEAVLAERGIRKVLLRRANALRTYVSELIAQQSGRWEVYDRSHLASQPPRIRFEMEQFVGHLTANKAFYAQLEAVLNHSGQEWFSVCYEHLLSQETQMHLLKYLGAPTNAVALEAKSVRQNPWQLRELVANYDELESAMHSTGFASWLDSKDANVQCGSGSGCT